MKDYYAILQIAPDATAPEIRKAYRRLAMQYHPDKMQAAESADVSFTEIQEAYEVLSNPVRKDAYIQQRWYNRAVNLNRHVQASSPAGLLLQLVDLRKYTLTLDRFRMDQYSLLAYLEFVFSPEGIAMLNRAGDRETRLRITDLTLNIMEMMDPVFQEKVIMRLNELTDLPAEAVTAIAERSVYIQRTKTWNRLRWPLVLLTVAAICVLIFFLSKTS